MYKSIRNFNFNVKKDIYYSRQNVVPSPPYTQNLV